MDDADAGGDRVARARRSGPAAPSSRNSPSSGTMDAGDDLDQRRLAGAVLAEQRVDRARRSVKSTRPAAPARPGRLSRRRAASSAGAVTRVPRALWKRTSRSRLTPTAHEDQAPSTTWTKKGSMSNSTSACVDDGDDHDAERGAATLTWPPLSAAPPITGAAKERISQSSPIEGWPSWSRAATSMIPASAARKPGDRVRGDDRTRPIAMPGKLGGVRVAAERRGCSARAARR